MKTHVNVDGHPTFERISDDRVSRAEVVAQHVTDLIMRAEVEPGAKLGTKSQLRTQFGVAASTVNEAIRLLEGRGLVDTRTGPQGGVFVATPSAQIRLSHLILGLDKNLLTVADGLEVRNALEVPLAIQAAGNRDAASIERLDSIVDRMGELQDDAAEYLRQNWMLHEVIAGMARNSLLRTIYVSLLDTARQALREVAPDPEFRETWRENLQLHQDLVDAITAGDPARAKRAAERHSPSAEAMHARTS